MKIFKNVPYKLKNFDKITKKDNLFKSFRDKMGDECLKFIPKTYILNDDDDLKSLENEIKLGKKFILKKNIQNKLGLKIVNSYEEIRNSLNDGYVIAQEFIMNSYLINKRKINIRLYLFIVIEDNKIYFYLSDIGKCIYTNKDYDSNIDDFESNITSYNLDNSIYDNNPMTIGELANHISLNDGVDKYLNFFKEIDLIFSHLKNVYLDIFIREKSCHFFGVDIILDENLTPYLLEVNDGPDMSYKSKKEEELKIKVVDDFYQIVGLSNYKNDNSFKEI